MSSCLAPWTQICPGAWTYRRPLRSLLRELSLTEWRKGKRRYSRIPCQSPSRRAGALEQPRRCSASSQLSCRATQRKLRELRGGTYVPSMHRKHSSNGRRSRIHGRNSGGVHRQVQRIFQSESSRSVSENKGEMIWQQAKRETRNTGKDISR